MCAKDYFIFKVIIVHLYHRLYSIPSIAFRSFYVCLFFCHLEIYQGEFSIRPDFHSLCSMVLFQASSN